MDAASSGIYELWRCGSVYNRVYQCPIATPPYTKNAKTAERKTSVVEINHDHS